MTKNNKKINKTILKSLKYIILVILSIIVVFPFYILLKESLHPNLVTMPYPVELIPKFFSGANYIILFQRYPVVKWIFNSFVIASITSAAQLLFCSMAAFGFSRTEFTGRKILLSLLMVMLVIPIQTRVLPLFLFMSNVGWVNSYLAWIPFFVDAFGIFLMMQFMEAIPREYDSAAFIDGANLFTTFTQVIAPQTKPAMVVLVTFNFINQWNDFLYPLIMVRNDSKYTLQLGLANIFSQAQRGEGGGIGVALAGAVISFIPTLIIFLVYQKQIISGMNISAGVKG